MSYDHNESIARDIDNNETMESGSRNSNIVFEVGDKVVWSIIVKNFWSIIMQIGH